MMSESWLNQVLNPATPTSHYLPFARQLVLVGSTTLDAQEQTGASQAIAQVIADLASGHSASELAVIAASLGITQAQLETLLTKSGLVTTYRQVPTCLVPTPLSMLCLGSKAVLYLTRYLNYELIIAKTIQRLVATTNQVAEQRVQPALAQLQHLAQTCNQPNAEQLQAILNSIQQRFSIITGGPGTGKTTTVTLLLWLYYQIYGESLKVQICAPTGKAAIRVRESISVTLQRLSAQSSELDFIALTTLIANNRNFATIHKLLGFMPNNIYFKHNQAKPLATEVLIVDESSMVGLPLFSKLCAALPLTTIKHVVLLGDSNQLSSVEEGYVFGALINLKYWTYPAHSYDLFAGQEIAVASQLTISNRNQGAVHELAQHILHNNPQAVLQVLTTAAQLTMLPASLSQILTQLALGPTGSWYQYLTKVQAMTPTSEMLFSHYTEQALLCLTNSGRLGTDNLNQLIEQRLKQQLAIASLWYTGRPIIILANDYNLEVFNGDIGICQVVENTVTIVFADGRQFIPEILPNYTLAYAITIHKSQGSEYGKVAVVLPSLSNLTGQLSSLLTKELLYTAVTRAKVAVSLFSDEVTITHACNQPTSRISLLPGLVQL